MKRPQLLKKKPNRISLMQWESTSKEMAQDRFNWLRRRFFASRNMLLDSTLQNKAVSVRLEYTYLENRSKKTTKFRTAPVRS